MTGNRQRQGRVENERQERRRRRDDSFEAQGSQNLVIPDDVKAKLDAEGRVGRWVNDEKGRVQRLTTKDDYDAVEGVEPVRVGENKDGSPLHAILLSKPAEFIREDREIADSRRRDAEKGMLRGRVAAKPGEEARPVEGVDGAQAYVPDGNSIGRENRIID